MGEIQFYEQFNTLLSEKNNQIAYVYLAVWLFLL